jgi:hypothetical protein
MISKKVIRYYADCGRAFWKKKACLAHEKVCKCWTNPKYKTCRTCKHSSVKTVHNEDCYITERDCKNAKFNYDKHFHPAHQMAPDLCINCELWESK